MDSSEALISLWTKGDFIGIAIFQLSLSWLIEFWKVHRESNEYVHCKFKESVVNVSAR